VRDLCGSLSTASNEAKTILLKAGLEPNEHGNYAPALEWNPYASWHSGVENYNIEFRFDSLSGFGSIASTTPDKVKYFDAFMNRPQKQYCYRVTGYQKEKPSVSSRSNIACVSTEPQVFAPNAFTVNSDNLNETFKLAGIFIEEFHLRIYNRFGELFFESHDINEGWDGTNKGQPAPSDVYVFMAEGKGRSGLPFAVKGTVTLLR
jgi:gliding motility-associated-like protein